MLGHVVVPVDGSAESFDAVLVGGRIAGAVDGSLHVVVVRPRSDTAIPRRALEREVDRVSSLSATPYEIVLTDESVTEVMTDIVKSMSDPLVVMSSHGLTRSAAGLGNATDEVLRAIGGPIVVVGSNCDIDRADAFDGAYVAPIDGSARAERVLPIVAAWTLRLGGSPWLLKVVDDDAGRSPSDRSYLAAVAHDLRGRTGRPVGYEVLGGERAARSVVEFARCTHASLIFASTHGRTGLAHLRCGSVAAEIVRRAPCPVVMIRPDDLSNWTDFPVIDVRRSSTGAELSDESAALLSV